jgi:signal-transduction protein with cAMP-binding, CBS, and nucleotidyltransferase domain
MGSEGRGEQILRTDQDNALIIRDGEDIAAFEPYMIELNGYLLQLGISKMQRKRHGQQSVLETKCQ